MNKWILGLSLLLYGCSQKQAIDNKPAIVSMQIMDRNGFSETISTRERLDKFAQIDFLSPQPYEKVLRVFARNSEGQASSCVTTYHPNGHLWQYLEVKDGRAHGHYQEWHMNGKLRIEALVVDGMPDVHNMAQSTWLFDGISQVWNEEGILIAEINYTNGLLDHTSRYYHASGPLWKEIPYHNNLIQGVVKIYDLEGKVIETIPYEKGCEHGTAKGPRYEECFNEGKLLSGIYTDSNGNIITRIHDGKGKRAIFENNRLDSLIEYHGGIADGLIQVFDVQGLLHSSFHIRDGKKNGEEIEYYAGGKQPKLSIYWHEDIIQGLAKTWYENGVMESQREINNNKKHGLSFAWYRDGQLMLMEEYDQDQLLKATYYKKGDKNPVSMIENGTGTATLFDPDGFLLKKVDYKKGKPEQKETP